MQILFLGGSCHGKHIEVETLFPTYTVAIPSPVRLTPYNRICPSTEAVKTEEYELLKFIVPARTYNKFDTYQVIVYVYILSSLASFEKEELINNFICNR